MTVIRRFGTRVWRVQADNSVHAPASDAEEVRQKELPEITSLLRCKHSILDDLAFVYFFSVRSVPKTPSPRPYSATLGTLTAMATETRSHHGCWSCRLRKKKCDERHPICTECMCVGLECHGFGEKPEWMDRGARQKAQAAKMKQKVAQVTKSRRMNQIRDQHESSMKRQQQSQLQKLFQDSVFLL